VKKHKILSILGIMSGAIFSVTACNGAAPEITPVSTTPVETSAPIDAVNPTDILLTPTPTEVPLAAIVNGEGIPMALFQAELERYRLANPEVEISTAEQRLVLDSLIDTLLLAQAAQEAGYSLTELELQARLEALIIQAGGPEQFQGWLDANRYTQDSFFENLAWNAAAAWMRDQISAEVPSTSEQVRARQVFLYNLEDAENVLDRLNAGTDFVTIAAEYDPIAAGELGWFPRGYLLQKEIEEAAFNLQPGEYSQVIETRLGYHLVEVIERQTDRLLEPDAQRILMRQAVLDWLETRRNQSAIEIKLP
jgi:parvulin-like peptidyl-prolyl isomerase